MREINSNEIEEAIYKLFLEANINLPCDVHNAIMKAAENEDTEIGKSILCKLDENAIYAKKSKLPICQDTGMAIVFIELGQDVHINGDNLNVAVNNGVRRAYINGSFRKSVVSHPLERKNSGDNTPAVIHTEIIEGNKVKISVSPKGFGSENMSKLKMFNPSVDTGAIVKFVTETVKEAGGNPCPPIIVGVGIGGSFEYSAYLAKKALLREVGDHNHDESYKKLEIEMLDKINKSGVGVQGLGGNNTALWVAVEGYATHIAGLPVAVNISCHATRHASIII
ncbi:MAG: fumarate hydratase [Clostridiales bacterium GWF2_38_85]|nr:MAG: fumarate hydratase [Clostridiales bacterium GWF2_38_85]HBL83905.1 fumarate hydratase [Clostridiales bacterium]